MKTVTLYRPVGPAELELVKHSNYTKWPPRLPGQPLFYPVLTAEYAARIAREWNVKDSGSGFVTQFEIKADYLNQFDVHIAGGEACKEYWIPAAQMEEFNSHIIGEIKVIQSFYPSNTGQNINIQGKHK